MTKQITLFLLLMVVPTTIVFAGDLGILFHSDLPVAVLQCPELYDMVSHGLDARANTHPEVLASFIVFIERFYGAGINNPDSNGLFYLREIEQHWLARKNTWLTEQVHLISKTSIDRHIRNSAVDIFEERINLFEAEPWASTTAAPDPRMVQYLIVKYYSDDSSMRYDSTADYEGARTRLEQAIVPGLRTSLEEMSSLPEQIIEDLPTRVLRNWHIFASGEYQLPSDPAPSLATAVVVQTLIAQHVLTATNRFFIMGGEFYGSTTLSTDATIPELGLQYPQEITLGLPLSSITAGYRIPLDDYLSPFGYVSIELSAGKWWHDDSRAFTVPGINASYPGRIFSLREGKISSINARAFVMTAKVPVLMFGNRFIAELGMTGGMLQVDLKVSYAYNYFWSNYDPRTGYFTFIRGDVHSTDGSRTQIVPMYSPVLDFRLRIVSGVEAEFRASLSYAGVSAGYSF